MAIIVETGQIISGANSYVSRADFILYGSSVGVVIADDETADVSLVKAAQYIDQHEARLKGLRVQRDQPMSFPRSDVCIDGWYWSSTEIPRQVILCQLAFALDALAGEDLWNRSPSSTYPVRSKRVEGAVSIEYAVGNTDAQKLSKASTGDALLASLLRNNGLFSIPAERG